MTRQALIALFMQDPAATDGDDVRFFKDGAEVTLATLDRVGPVDGIYPGTEPNVNAYLKLSLS